MKKTIQSRRVKLLRDSVAQKIAAGEVIDRPFSVVRELLDNSIDAGADTIDLYVSGGGLERIRVVDNGAGMSKDDLELCYLPHATSKITEMEDLDTLRSLGFRGEALSSVAACSRLEVLGAPREGECWELKVDNGKQLSLAPATGNRGCVVQVSDLFYSIPARRKFLKSPGSETNRCRETFLEKALPFHEIAFRFFTNDKLRLFLPAAQRLDRVCAAYPQGFKPGMTVDFHEQFPTHAIQVIASTPSVYRRDRRQIHIFVNNRKIQEYGLVQAVEYGFADLLPGGCFPSAVVFLEIDPALVDFNIHPAKREVRFRNLPEIHHNLTRLLRQNLMAQYSTVDGGNSLSVSAAIPEQRILNMNTTDTNRSIDAASALSSQNPHANSRSRKLPGGAVRLPTEPAGQPEWHPPKPRSARKTRYSDPDNTSGIDSLPVGEIRVNWKELKTPEPEPKTESDAVPAPFRYIGQLFHLFLLVEQGDNFLLIDQHAAHERILFNAYTQKLPPVQQMLIPLEFEPDPPEEEHLESHLADWESFGFAFRKKSAGAWTITAMPEPCVKNPEEIVAILLKGYSNRREIEQQLFASMSCRRAIKDGEELDRVTAERLIAQTLALPVPRCPHGRPVWLTLDRAQLFEFIGRTGGG